MASFSDYLLALEESKDAALDFVGQRLRQGVSSLDLLPEPVRAGLGAGFQGWAWLADAPQRYVVRPGLGAVAKVGIDPTRVMNMTLPASIPLTAGLRALEHRGDPVAMARSAMGGLRLAPERVEAARAADSLTGAFEAAYQGRPVEKLSVELLFDPTIWLTFLTLGKLGKLGQYTDLGVELYNRAVALPLTAGLRGARWALEKPGLLKHSNLGQAAGELEELAHAIWDLRRNGWRFKPARVGDGLEQTEFVFHKRGGAEDEVQGFFRELGLEEVPLRRQGDDLVATLRMSPEQRVEAERFFFRRGAEEPVPTARTASPPSLRFDPENPDPQFLTREGQPKDLFHLSAERIARQLIATTPRGQNAPAWDEALRRARKVLDQAGEPGLFTREVDAGYPARVPIDTRHSRLEESAASEAGRHLRWWNQERVEDTLRVLDDTQLWGLRNAVNKPGNLYWRAMQPGETSWGRTFTDEQQRQWGQFPMRSSANYQRLQAAVDGEIELRGWQTAEGEYARATVEAPGQRVVRWFGEPATEPAPAAARVTAAAGEPSTRVARPERLEFSDTPTRPINTQSDEIIQSASDFAAFVLFDQKRHGWAPQVKRLSDTQLWGLREALNDPQAAGIKRFNPRFNAPQSVVRTDPDGTRWARVPLREHTGFNDLRYLVDDEIMERMWRTPDGEYAVAFAPAQASPKTPPLPTTGDFGRYVRGVRWRSRPEDLVAENPAWRGVFEGPLGRVETIPEPPRVGDLSPRELTIQTVGESDPLPAVATLEQAVYRVRDELAAAGERVDPALRGQISRNAEALVRRLEPVLGANPQHLNIHLIYTPGSTRRVFERALAEASPDKQARIVADWLEEIGQQWEAFGLRVPGVVWLQRVLGDTRKPVAQTRLPAGQRYQGGMLDEAVETLRRWSSGEGKVGGALASPQEALATIQRELDSLDELRRVIADREGIGWLRDSPLTSMEDLRQVVERFGTPEEQARVGKLLELWHEPATLEAGEILAGKLLGDARREVLRRYKLTGEEKGAYLRIYDELMGLYKTQVLLTPRWQVVNTLDMVTKSALEGVNPVAGRSAHKVLAEYGEQVAPGAYAIVQRQLAPEEFGQGVWGLSRGNLRRLLREGDSAQRGQQIEGVAGRAIRGAWRVLGPLGDLNGAIARAVENSFREAAYATYFDQHMQRQVLPYFREEIARRLPAERAGLVLDTLEAREGRLSLADLRHLLGRVAPEQVEELGALWQRGLGEAQRVGVEHSHRVHFRYADERVIEQKLGLRYWLPFHIWATRNLPYYATTLAQNPWLLRAYYQYQETSEEERQELGLTQRFRDKLPAGGLGLLTFLLGEEGVAWFNPTIVVSIFEQTQAGFERPDAPIPEKLLNDLGRIGLRPAPWFTSALNVLGYTRRPDPEHLLRHTRLVEGLTGLNPEAGWHWGARRLREHLSGRLPGSDYVPGDSLTGSNYRDYLVWKRIAEMSIQETGRPNHPLFQAAMADPESPIFQEALQRVRRERLFFELYGMLSPLPMAWLGETEGAIRGRAARYPEELSPQLRERLREQGDLGTGYWNVPGDQRRAQINAGHALFGYYGWGQSEDTRAAIDERLPWFARYVAWKREREPGSDTSIRRFLDEQTR